MDKDIKKEFENLAGMVNRGFDDMHQHVRDVDNAIDERLLSLEKETRDGFRHVSARLDVIEKDIYLELKLGIESGK